METTPTPVRRNKASRVSLIAGILSLISGLGFLFLYLESASWYQDYYLLILYCPGFTFTLIATIIAILWGWDALSEIEKSRELGKEYAVAGIILGALTILLFVLLLTVLPKPAILS